MDAYLPQDRRQALLQGSAIPERCRGAVLFADLSGFTPLTEALSQAMSPRQAAERLAQQITSLYDTLTAQIGQWHGSVVGFAGDAITGWFDDQDGASVERAVACALAMQQAMPGVATLTLPSGATQNLALKVSIAYGPARRLVVGDPQIQQFDVLTGATLNEVAAIEHIARPGEVLISEAAAQQLDFDPPGAQWLTDPEGLRAIAIAGLAATPAPDPWSLSNQDALRPEQLRPWILPAIYERYQQGLSDFLSELRPAVPMFVRFASLDYDEDEAAGTHLNEFVCAAQQIINRYGGALLQIVIGDKGSSMYAVFGAPISHENDASRAALAALELHQFALVLPAIAPLQIGISAGTLLVGAYGTVPSRTYAAMGDAVNVAARLMMAAAPAETLVTDRVHGLIAQAVQVEERTPLRLKGKALPQPVSAVLAPLQRRGIQLEEPRYRLPMVGRYAEREQLGLLLSRAAAGRGQLIGLSGEAGQGKSRLVAELIRLAHVRGFTSYGGACLSIGKHMSYLVWEPIWQSFFELGSETAAQDLAGHLRGRLEALLPGRAELVPLLGPLLGVSLPDTPVTRALEPQDRQRALHALLRDCLLAAVSVDRLPQQKVLIVLEDLHWIDELSFALLLDLAQVIADVPVLIVLAYRSEPEIAADIQQLAGLPYWSEIVLGDLRDHEAADLIKMRLRLMYPDLEEAPLNALIQHLLSRTRNNPFYLEELLHYLHDQRIDLRDLATLEAIELPDSVQRLVLSRLDQLSVRQQALVKSASVIGRRFLMAWLQGSFGTLQYADNLPSELQVLAKTDLIAFDAQDPELAYVFKHIITRDVAYSSLSDATRSMLHEQVAAYLEKLVGEHPEPYLDLLAYHYDHSHNLSKRRTYLRRAADAAAARAANESAISYYTRSLEIAAEDAVDEHYELLVALEHLYSLVGDIAEQKRVLDRLRELVDGLDNPVYRAYVLLLWAEYMLQTGSPAESIRAAQEAYDAAIAAQLPQIAARAQICYCWNIVNKGQEYQSEVDQRLHQVLEFADSHHDRMAKLLVLRLLINRAVVQGKYAESRELTLQGLEISRDLYLYRDEANMLQFLGWSSFELGFIEEAISSLASAAQAFQIVDDRQYGVMAQSHLMCMLCLCGRLQRAQECLEQVHQTFRLLGLSRMTSFPLAYESIYFDQLGDYAQALQPIEQALEKVRAYGALYAEGSCLNILALIHLHLDDTEQALALCQQAVSSLLLFGDSPEYALSLTIRGNLLTFAGQWEAAEQVFQQAAALRAAFQQHHLVNEPLAGLAVCALALGRQAEALAHVNAIMAFLEQHRLDGAIEPFRIYLRCYEVLIATGDGRAPALLDRAYNELQSWAAGLSDPAARRRFLEDVRVNHRIVSLWNQIFGDTQAPA